MIFSRQANTRLERDSLLTIQKKASSISSQNQLFLCMVICIGTFNISILGYAKRADTRYLSETSVKFKFFRATACGHAGSL